MHSTSGLRSACKDKVYKLQASARSDGTLLSRSWIKLFNGIQSRSFTRVPSCSTRTKRSVPLDPSVSHTYRGNKKHEEGNTEPATIRCIFRIGTGQDGWSLEKGLLPQYLPPWRSLNRAQATSMEFGSLFRVLMRGGSWTRRDQRTSALCKAPFLPPMRADSEIVP
jgi:hypothetical protein